MTVTSKQKISYVIRENYNEIGHNSGINSLALDTKTPGGLLYTAGKDSKINSWDLHLDEDNINPYYVKHDNFDNNGIENTGSQQIHACSSLVDIPNDDTQNIEFSGSPDSSRDFSFTKNFHSEEVTRANSYSQGFRYGSTTAISIRNNIHRLRQKFSQNFDLRRKKCVTQTPTFHKDYWYHSDWVNDIVLTANKDHIISASSDRSIYLWDVNNNVPNCRIGFHKDDVRVLAYSPKCNWVASGGFDQRVLFWDIVEGRAKPIFNSDDSLTQSSIYSMATNEEGNVLVTGSPERIVRIWDTRIGKQVLKLTGHSDNVRALLVSDDGKWVLSGSSDSTIKLWSIANFKRCVMTYSHYSDSVWSLTSNDPYLKTFYAGGRDGSITKINQSSNYDYNNQYDSDYGDCVLVCKENSGVVKLAAIDNGYIYAATSSSNINCWRDIPLSPYSLHIYKDQNPDDFEKITIQKSSIITQPNDIINDSLYTFNQIQSVASVDTRSSLNNNYYDNDFSTRQSFDEFVVPIFPEPEATITGKPPIVKFTMFNDRRHVLTQDAEKNVDEWDIILCKKSKVYGKVDYDKILKETNKRIFTENWCSLDIHTGALTVSLMPNKIFDSLIYYDECLENMLVPDSLLDSRVNVGRWVLTNLMYNFIMTVNNKDPEEESKLMLKSTVDELSEKINTESSKPPPSNSSIRCLTPFVTEDSCSIPESIGNLSMTSLTKNESIKLSSNVNTTNNQKPTNNTNTKKPMFPELRGDYSDEEDDDNSSSYHALSPENTEQISEPLSREILPDNLVSSTTIDSKEIPSNNNSTDLNSSSFIKNTNINNNTINNTNTNSNASIANNNNNNNNNNNSTNNYLTPPKTNDVDPNYLNSLSNDKTTIISSQSTPVLSKGNSNTSSNLQLTSQSNSGNPTSSNSALSKDNNKSELSLKKSNSSMNGTSSSEQVKRKTSDASNHSKKKEKGFMNKIRSHVHIRSSSNNKKEGKKTSSSVGNMKLLNSSPLANPNIGPVNPPIVKPIIPEPKTDGPINFAETPYVKLPEEVPIFISNLESDDAVTYIDQDRETIKSLGDPNTTKYLCDNSLLPKWAYDCVINKKIPNIEIRKVNFVLKPYQGSDMPPLPLGNNHLCANRMLRIRKVITYVADKLNLFKIPKTSKTSTVSLSDLNTISIDGIKAENYIEILCNDEVLEPTTTLATCKNHYSKTSGDVVLCYRYIVKEIK